MLINVFLIVSLFVFLMLGWIWSNRELQLHYKLFFFFMAGFAAACIYQAHIKDQLDYINHEKAKIAIEREALENRDGVEIRD